MARKNAWEKFDEKIDTEALQKNIASAAGNDFPEVPEGTYRVKVKKMEGKTSKTGKPMCSIQFQIMEGDYRKSMIFYNQVLWSDNRQSMGRFIHDNNGFLKSMELECVGEHPFKNYSQYAELIMDAAEEIDDNGLEFDLYYPGPDGWPNNFRIEEVYEA